MSISPEDDLVASSKAWLSKSKIMPEIGWMNQPLKMINNSLYNCIQVAVDSKCIPKAGNWCFLVTWNYFERNQRPIVWSLSPAFNSSIRYIEPIIL